MDEKELCQDPTPGHSSQSVTSTLRWEVGGGGGAGRGGEYTVGLTLRCGLIEQKLRMVLCRAQALIADTRPGGITGLVG